MKKTLLSVLIVLLLSFVLFGCGGDACEVCGETPCICKAASASNLSPLARDALTALGEEPATFPTPLGTTFDKFDATAYGIVIVWKDANQSMFNNYKSAWEARAAFPVVSYSSLDSATIDFYSTEGTESAFSLEYSAGSIVFSGTK